MFKTMHSVQTSVQPVKLVANNSNVTVEASREIDRLLRLPEVMKLSALKRSSLYKKIQQGNFPEPVKIGARASAWRLSDVIRWVEAPMQFVGRSAAQ